MVVRALRPNTLPKLTFEDSGRLDSLVRDVFPGVEMRAVEQPHLEEEALRDACIESNLVLIAYLPTIPVFPGIYRDFSFASASRLFSVILL